MLRVKANRGVWAWLAALVLVSGCGGGGDGATGQGTAFTQGAIAGFGSVIVNGVRFDDSAAQVSDDDDSVRSRGELKLGMMVEIESSEINAGSNTATARHIRFGSEIVGPVAAIVNTATDKSLKVLDQIIEVIDTTVFDDSLAGGLAAIHVNDVIEVHALFDAVSGHYIAKRIEPAAGATSFKLRGTISALDTTLKTFKIGNAVIAYGGIAAANLPALANGMKVRVRLQTAQVSNQWVAISVRSGERKIEDHDEADVRGTITEFTSATKFSVNGLPVDATNATFPDGTAGLVLGAQVEVEGAVRDGVLIARKVELEDSHMNDGRHGIELHGAIAGLNLDTKTFTVRGVKVSYSNATQFQGGTAANLANDKLVEVKGKLAADGVTVEALRIMFES